MAYPGLATQLDPGNIDGMNHAPVCTAIRDSRRMRWIARAMAVALAALLGAFASDPARAQSETGYSDLPGTGSVDAASDPFPFDPRLAIRRYIKDTLPSLWWANEVEQSLGTFSVMIHVPDEWRGNPTSALMSFCPPAYSVLWRHIDRIDLVPFYKHVRWPGTTCRK